VAPGEFRPGLGGTFSVFDLDAHLAGLMPMSPGQQDVLACSLNERLTDLSEKVRVPYLTALPERCADASKVPEEGHLGILRHDEQGLVPPPPAAFQQPPEERTGLIPGRGDQLL
jgi:hypothetical protein